MPRFFFDLYDGEDINVDTMGVELADEQVARDEATRTLTEIAAQEIPGNGDSRDFLMVVRNAPESTLFEIRIVFHSQATYRDG